MVSESQGFWSPSLAAERTRRETRVTELRRLTRNRFPLPQICDRRRNRHGEGARFGHDLTNAAQSNAVAKHALMHVGYGDAST
jgi:hypothetical protein